MQDRSPPARRNLFATHDRLLIGWFFPDQHSDQAKVVTINPNYATILFRHANSGRMKFSEKDTYHFGKQDCAFNASVGPPT